MSLIEIKKVNKPYESGDECVLALCDVDLNIERGEFISVMGPSGSGKSTLLTILGGLNHPTKGDVVVDDIPIYTLSLESKEEETSRSTLRGRAGKSGHCQSPGEFAADPYGG